MKIILNGTELEVKSVKFDESDKNSENYYHDCHITFGNDKPEVYDASDVTIISN